MVLFWSSYCTAKYQQIIVLNQHWVWHRAPGGYIATSPSILSSWISSFLSPVMSYPGLPTGPHRLLSILNHTGCHQLPPLGVQVPWPSLLSQVPLQGSNSQQASLRQSLNKILRYFKLCTNITDKLTEYQKLGILGQPIAN